MPAFEPAYGDFSPRPSTVSTDLSPVSPVLMSVVDSETLHAAWAMLLDQLQVWPTWLWLIGVGALLVARALACRRFLNDLQPAAHCPAHVQRMVRDVAARIGLRRAPEIVMVTNCISPMVSCVGRRRLLLPVDLWNQLDDQGRRAVLFHELAHLRRRDHWVRWAESLISMIYWWNPLVWFVRNRVHDEAENCCDAWVTWIWPEGRSAYARALLKTSAFISAGRAPVPLVGIGMTSVRARRFARRLTMVMTESSRPRLSASGVAMAAILAATGWLFTPAWSLADNCPKSEKHEATCESHATEEAPEASEIIELSEADAEALQAMIAESDSVAAEATPLWNISETNGLGSLINSGAALMNGAIGLEEQTGPRARRHRDDEDVETRIHRLERRIEELMAQMDSRVAQMDSRVAQMDSRVGSSGGSGGGGVRAPVARSGPYPPVAPLAGLVAIQPRMPATPSPATGEKEVRVYHVSHGKLDALVQLMSRQDVPILISAQNDGIHVTATPTEHEVFNAFVHMIDPKDGAPRMSIGGVSVIPAPAPSRMRSPARSAIRVPAPGAVGMGMGKLDAKLSNRLAEIERRQTSRARERDRDAMEEHRDQLLEQADVLRDRAEEMKERAAELKDAAREALTSQAQELVRQASELAAHAKGMEKSLKDAERDLEKLEIESELADAYAEAKDDEDDADDEDDENDADHADHAAHIKQELKALNKSATAQKARQNWYDKGYSLHNAKKYDEAIECFMKAAEIENRKQDSYYNIACGYSLKGDKDRAFEWLRKAWHAGYQDVNHMESDSDLDNIRNDARFKQITGGKKQKHDDDDDESSR
ncbi:MAG: M56 family metallopeptidase [Planctomycetota bacterium]